ncbi:hypothetical protein HRbin08_01813 [bacterium HR08]|nr:hypothetical protein HRbin08_01813 [bacterium HR08]
MRGGASAGGLTHPRRTRGSAQQRAHGRGERDGIPGGHQKPRLARDDDLARSPEIGRDHRAPGGHRLAEDHAERFRPRGRMHEKIARGEHFWDLAPKSREDDPLAEPQGRDQRAKRRRVSRSRPPHVPPHDQESHIRHLRAEESRGAEEAVISLPGLQATDRAHEIPKPIHAPLLTDSHETLRIRRPKAFDIHARMNHAKRRAPGAENPTMRFRRRE